MICNVVLLSGVQQSKSVIHAYTYIYMGFQVVIMLKNLPTNTRDI